MKSNFWYLFIVYLLFFVNADAAPLSFNGKVIDAETKEPLPAAIVSIPDLKISVVTNTNGEFSFTNIPDKGRFLVVVRYLGYQTFTRTVDLSVANNLVFALSPTMIEAKEVVVTGTASGTDSKKNSTSVGSLNRNQLLNHPSTNLMDAIARVPGVSQISTGLAISKPVIRGLSATRIVTLSDGVKQQGQQWGDEHGVELDQYGAERVEVLRGPSSLLYGSDAIGGVINVLEPLPAPQGQIRGEFLSNYATNNGQTGSSLMLTGNHDGWIWRGRGSYKSAYSFKTPAGYYPNSGYDETDLSGMLGLSKKMGLQ